MARITVKFGVTQRTSQTGNEYYLIEMRTSDKNGQMRELPDVRMTPFSARLLLEHLPELCDGIKEGERLKAQGGPPPQAPDSCTGQGGQQGVANPNAGPMSVGPDGVPQPYAPPQQTQQQPVEEETPF